MKNHILNILTLACCAISVMVSAITTDIDSGNIVDAPMSQIRRDGRNSDVRSVFEEMRLKLEEKEAALSEMDHPMLTRHGENIDVQMDMLWDWNHIINLTFTNANDTI